MKTYAMLDYILMVVVHCIVGGDSTIHKLVMCQTNLLLWVYVYSDKIYSDGSHIGNQYTNYSRCTKYSDIETNDKVGLFTETVDLLVAYI